MKKALSTLLAFFVLLTLVHPVFATPYSRHVCLLLNGANQVSVANKSISDMEKMIHDNWNSNAVKKWSYNCDNNTIKASVLKSFISDYFSVNTAETDVSVFYYIGHGTKDGLFINPSSTISYKDLAEALACSKSNTILVFIDSCYSANLNKGIMSLNQNDRKRFVVYAASDENEEAEFSMVEMRSRLTYAICGGLDAHRYSDMNHDGVVTASELGEYTSLIVKDFLLDNNDTWKDQTPRFYTYASEKNDYNVAVGETNLTISKSALSIAKGEKHRLKLTVKGKNATPIWKTSKSSVATVDSSGLVTAKGIGKATISASANGKTVKCAVTVVSPSIKLSKNTLSMIKGKTYTLKPTVKGASSKVTWTSTDKKIATVTSDGTIKAIKPGKASITASANGLKAKCVVTVKDASIQLDKSSLSIEVGKKYTLKATVKGATSKVSWASSKSSIAAVNSSGVITAKKVGTTVITAKANGKTAKCTVKVTPKKYRASGTYGSLKWVLDETGTLTISGKGKMPDARWDDDLKVPWNYPNLYDFHRKSKVKIKKVVIKEGVTSIGSLAFFNCGFASKATISIPSTVTAINRGALDYADVQSISVSSGSKHFATKDGVLFNKKMTKLIYYPPQKTNNTYYVPKTVKEIGRFAFVNCEKLRKLYLPKALNKVGGESDAFIVGVGIECYTSVYFSGDAPSGSWGEGATALYYPKGNKTYTKAKKRALLGIPSNSQIKEPEERKYINEHINEWLKVWKTWTP